MNHSNPYQFPVTCFQSPGKTAQKLLWFWFGFSLIGKLARDYQRIAKRSKPSGVITFDCHFKTALSFTNRDNSLKFFTEFLLYPFLNTSLWLSAPTQRRSVRLIERIHSLSVFPRFLSKQMPHLKRAASLIGSCPFPNQHLHVSIQSVTSNFSPMTLYSVFGN